MSFGQFFSILRARWWVVVLVLVLTIGGAAGVSLLLPKSYTATASVVVDSKPDPVSALMFGGMASPAFMATQVDIIKSERVAQRVVANLKLAENPEIRQQWLAATQGQGSLESWVAGTFQQNMEVTPSRESSVINVSYNSPDPRFAAGLANAFVQAYIETSLALRVDPARQYSSFFETRAKEARDALEKAQALVSTFQRQNGIIANDERLDVENARLNELSSQLTMLQALSAESGSRQAVAQGGQADKLQEVLNSGIVSQLKAELIRNETRLKEISTRLGDAHPQVQELKASIREVSSRLDSETRKVTTGVGVTAGINRARVGETRAALDSQRSRVLKMKSVRDEGAVLLRDVENAQRNYDAVFQRFTQTSMEGQTTQSNVNVLQQASAPTLPSSPKVLRNILLAAFGGTVLALVSAMALELSDRRLRSLDDVVNALDLPVLGVMPRPGVKARLSARNSLSQQRLLTSLPGSAKGA